MGITFNSSLSWVSDEIVRGAHLAGGWHTIRPWRCHASVYVPPGKPTEPVWILCRAAVKSIIFIYFQKELSPGEEEAPERQKSEQKPLCSRGKSCSTSRSQTQDPQVSLLCGAFPHPLRCSLEHVPCSPCQAAVPPVGPVTAATKYMFMNCLSSLHICLPL